MNTAKLMRTNLLKVALVTLAAALFAAIGLMLVAVERTDAQAQTTAATRQVWAWGSNDFGQVRDGTTTDRKTPVQVSGLSGVQAISGGDGHSLALKNDGTVWAWGSNQRGELGDGSPYSMSNTPVQVSGLSDVQAIDGGGFHSLAMSVASAQDSTPPTLILSPDSLGR